MLKQLLATVAVTACCLGNPAAAAPSTCWFSGNDGSKRVAPQRCDVGMRTNANGHKVVDITSFVDNSKISIVFWKNTDGSPYYAEVFFKNSGRTVWKYRRDKDGDIHLYHPGTGMEIWFAVPRTSVTPVDYV